MDWITKQIAIGNYLDAQNIPSEVNAVLCLKRGCFCLRRTDVDAEYIPLNDGPGNKSQDLKDALAFIDDVVSSGEKILVHCHAGRSRSVIVVARYFMENKIMSRTEALAKIEAEREIYLSTGIESLLSIDIE